MNHSEMSAILEPIARRVPLLPFPVHGALSNPTRAWMLKTIALLASEDFIVKPRGCLMSQVGGVSVLDDKH